MNKTQTSAIVGPTVEIHTRLKFPNLPIAPAYTTASGAAYCGDSLELLAALPDNSINLVMTSPPFALQRQKAYGNKDQADYIDWLVQFARQVHPVLKDDGSFVLDLGGAYEKGVPTRSLYNFRVLIRFCDDLGFFLAEDFYWFNPSKLPSPIEWVNKRKLRVKDAVNTVWWFSKTEWPKADIGLHGRRRASGQLRVELRTRRSWVHRRGSHRSFASVDLPNK
jgi:DNA methylase